MGLRASDVELSDQAAAALTLLEASHDSTNRAIAKRARSYRVILLADALHGEVVKKPLPKALVQRHGIENLFVEDLPGFWRLLYSVVRVGLERRVFVVEIVDHAQYDKWFPNKGK